MKENIFRAYDIRGKYPEEIDEEVFYTLGKSYGSYIKEKYHQDKCVLSHDNRLSSESLTNSVMKGIMDSGCNVIYLGLTTTPMNYFARHYLNIPGVMVTASHNPKDDNGLKFSFDGMINARGEMIDDFKKYTLQGEFLEGSGTCEDKDIFNEYLDYLYKDIRFGNHKIKVIFDPGNGVGSDYVHKVFNNNEHFEALFINDISDGTFPNHHPDPSVKENMKDLQKAVIDNKADVGIAFDGDADRIGIVTNEGKVLPIEYFMNLCIGDMFTEVEKKEFLYDIKCSKSVEDYITSLGGKSLCYRTGASYTEYKTYEENLPFGCEYSGHVYFRDRTFDCCSAFYASLRFIEILSKVPVQLNRLIENFSYYYATEEERIPCDDNKKFEVCNKIVTIAKEKGYNINDIDGARITFDDGWVLVRASNTGPNITFRCEGVTEKRRDELKEEYLNLINDLSSGV